MPNRDVEIILPAATKILALMPELQHRNSYDDFAQSIYDSPIGNRSSFEFEPDLCHPENDMASFSNMIDDSVDFDLGNGI